jgi:hypothetical protein
MSERLETVILVTDKGSQTFLKVGDSATKMGTSIDRASTQSSASLGRLSKAGAAAGAAFASMAGFLSIASRANADAEASQQRLETAFENAGSSVDEYSTQLDAASKKALQLGFDDEDAADSIAKLTNATHDGQKAINDLALAEDISRARKIDLASATNIVIAAEQGRFGALKRMGIAIDENASSEQALAALHKQFAGNAEAYSETSAAGYDRMKNAAENALEAIGSHLGPSQQLLMILPGLSAGFTGVGAAVGALAPEMTLATVGASALSLALGPVGIALGAAAAGVAIYELYQHLHNEAVPGEKEANEAAKVLNDTLREQLQIGSKLAPLTAEVGQSFDYIGNASKNYMGEVQRLNSQLTDLKQNHQDQMVIIGETADGIPIVELAWKEAERQLNEYIKTQRDNKVSMEDLAAAQTAANTIIRDAGPAAEEARAELEALYKAEQAGTLYTNEGETQWQAYLRGIIAVGNELPTMNQYLIEQGIATDKAAEAVERYNALFAVGSAAFASMNTQMGEYKSIRAEIDAQNVDKKQEAAATSFGKLESSMGAAIETQNAWLADQYRAAEASAAAAESFLKQASSIGVLDTELEKLVASGVSTWAERTANRVLHATDGLASGISVIIDGTKSLSSQSSGLDDWARDLINVEGSYGKIDDLLAHGQISLTTYNRAQESGNRIFADNALIQEDLLRIQTKQAPLLADLADKQTKYIDQLADLPPQQELVALGWMDQNEALKATNALQLAAAASAGEYGAAGQAAAEQAITAQAQADPAFAAMLEDMGLISVGADGTISVNFPDSETIQEAVDGLSESVDALTVALGGVPPGVHTDVSVSGVDTASSLISGYSYLLDTVNGKQVYTSVYVDALGPGLRLTPGYAHGGVIPHAQHGLFMGNSSSVIMNEAGPEVVRLPNGSMIYPAPASKEMTKQASASSIVLHNATFNIYANNVDDFADDMRSRMYGDK